MQDTGDYSVRDYPVKDTTGNWKDIEATTKIDLIQSPFIECELKMKWELLSMIFTIKGDSMSSIYFPFIWHFFCCFFVSSLPIINVVESVSGQPHVLCSWITLKATITKSFQGNPISQMRNPCAESKINYPHNNINGNRHHFAAIVF